MRALRLRSVRAAALAWARAATSASASAFEAIAPAARRPHAGRVRSGRGARGGAQLGVRKLLEEMQIPVDMIVGAGTIMAASHASGRPPPVIEKANEPSAHPDAVSRR